MTNMIYEGTTGANTELAGAEKAQSDTIPLKFLR
jgi:hypothetical protein